LDLKGKIVIVVDDGIATGRTILATIKMLRSKHPKKLVVAVPVASKQAAERISKEVDEFICLHIPVPFFGVGRFYEDFNQTTDEEVTDLLKELNARGHAA
jgi:putative phosphoribosyl transferase